MSSRERIYMRCVGDAFLSLVPIDEQQEKALSKSWEEGEVIEITVRRGRSIQQHRLFFGILQHVAESSEWEVPERLLVALKLQLGRYDLMALPSGKVAPIPHSVSFSEMGQDEFQDFFEKALDLICDKILGGYDKEQLIQEVEGKVNVSLTRLPPRHSVG